MADAGRVTPGASCPGPTTIHGADEGFPRLRGSTSDHGLAQPAGYDPISMGLPWSPEAPRSGADDLRRIELGTGPWSKDRRRGGVSPRLPGSAHVATWRLGDSHPFPAPILMDAFPADEISIKDSGWNIDLLITKAWKLLAIVKKYCQA